MIKINVPHLKQCKKLPLLNSVKLNYFQHPYENVRVTDFNVFYLRNLNSNDIFNNLTTLYKLYYDNEIIINNLPP